MGFGSFAGVDHTFGAAGQILSLYHLVRGKGTRRVFQTQVFLGNRALYQCQQVVGSHLEPGLLLMLPETGNDLIVVPGELVDSELW